MKNVTQDGMNNYSLGLKMYFSLVNSLISSGIKVVIYSGQLDLIVDTVGMDVHCKILHVLYGIRYNGLD